jgi:flagella basal body P-ring formation protein FlgA
MRILILTAVAALALTTQAHADTTVTADAIQTRISETMAERLPSPGRYKVVLADPGFMLTLPDEAQGRFDIAALTFDPARQSFNAALAYTTAGGERQYVRIAGAAAAVVTVPTLVRDVAPGETIAEADLTTIEIAANRLSAQTLTQPTAIAGQAARRMLRANTPLQTYDVRKPVLIKKGDLVTVIYALDGIALTAQGQAQAEAGLGDTLPVLNTRSRRTIDTRVTGAGTATVVVPNADIAAIAAR